MSEDKTAVAVVISSNGIQWARGETDLGVINRLGLKVGDRLELCHRRTGLKDKNGKGICEGDVLRVRFGVGYPSRYYPSFVSGTERVSVEVVEYLHCGYPALKAPDDENFEKEFEVIGNIHENPEAAQEQQQ
jgi:uncharacterized phage protein (TIGR01671 family)